MTTTSTRQLLTVDEAAEFLGIRPSTVRANILRMKMPYVKIGRCVRLKISDLTSIIEKGTHPARPDPEITPDRRGSR
jgi:excisionase family DNA binding protein